METNENTIIGELVAKHYAFSDVFYNYKIDFCCGGNISIGEACNQQGLSDSDKQNLFSALNELNLERQPGQINPNEWPLDFLVDYIEKKHHHYIETNVPVIKQYLEKIALVHGEKNPELIPIRDLFIKGSGDLVQHLKKEELMLFPAIRKMEKQGFETNDLEKSVSKLNEILALLSVEHDDGGALFREISVLSNGYTLPDGACNTYRVAYMKLKEFEADLHYHIHLENNILFNKLRSKLEQLEENRVA